MVEDMVVAIEGYVMITTKVGTYTEVENAITHLDATDMAEWTI